MTRDGIQQAAQPLRRCRLLVRAVLSAATLLVVLSTALPAQAKRYLTTAEAQKLFFPQADAFEERILRFSPEQAVAIEKQSGVKVRNSGQRFWLAKKGDELQGLVVIDFVTGKHETIDYTVALTPSGEVKGIEILEYRESYGGEVRGKRWRAQFEGKTVASPLKLHDDIHNITGATMSSRHVTEGVKRVLFTFEVAIRPLLHADGGLRALPAHSRH